MTTPYAEKVAQEEASPMSAEEARWFEEALQAVPEDQRKAFVTIPMDVLCVREPIHVQPQVFRVSFLFARICLVLP